MKKQQIHRFLELTKLFSKPHPWHGISSGKEAPETLTVFIEIVPGDTMKYELDKQSGYLRVDRPQRFSSISPVPYGFVPQTLCADSVAEYCMEQTGKTGIKGDDDPLDICVVTERIIPHGNLILEAIPIGGFRMIDGNEADDKILAVMKGDALYGEIRSMKKFPKSLKERLHHYFLTYKQMPDDRSRRECEITDIYDRDEALEVIRRSMADYRNKFDAGKKELLELMGNLEDLLEE